MENLKPIKLLPAREQVAAALRKAILAHEILEGEELTLDSVSEMMGVSSTPIREAFQMLARDGFIKLRPNKGAIVLGVNQKTICDHYETRAILERECAMAVCRNKADLSGILQAYKQGREAVATNDARRYSDLNQAFHVEIWAAGGNDKIKSLLSTLWNGLSLGQNVTEEAYAKISIAEHEEILEALIARDEKRAGDLMNRHILRSMENILTHLDHMDANYEL